MSRAPRPAGEDSSFRWQGLLWVLVTALGWGLNWPMMKFALSQWPVFTFRVVTSLAGAALLLALAAARSETLWPRDRRQWGRLSLAGVLNITSFVGLGTLSLRWLDASEAAIIAYTMPIWAAMLAWPVLGERPTLPRLAGLAVGFMGVGVLLGPLVATGSGAPMGTLAAKWPGIACILGTAVMFAAGAVLTKRLPTGMPPLSGLAWQILLGTVPILWAALAFERWDVTTIGIGGWLAAFYVAFVALCLAYFAWFRALRLLPAGTATIGTLLVPMIGVLGAGLALGEPLGWRQGVALAMTVSGVVLASRG
ncbi:Permease of the drug/metabolite transporter (DMT) superfamily [Rhodovastum atsumiense]|uniref:DMT family transporter n=1 Tax=Rhodovastum atsumiense TaxID=504468 RepID=A0A5M6ITZ2_9PROT|nr:DMT family transporter [Rhodovastum atsumiense]KAA5610998.1 DMT family transporter [Rhodovastum atsumiense]CAH2600221.1 Permease of the drug/metabolite transporter (DMT) superfamily [Rhodovastum atsumiense]